MAKPVSFLFCHFCGKCVSTGFRAIHTDTPDHSLIVRACIICPECIETQVTFKKDTPLAIAEDKMVEDTCRKCGKHVGWGILAFHVGICDDCSEAEGY